MPFENKLVAIINKDIDIGVAMNALAHMTLGLGAHLTKEPLKLENYRNAQGHVYPNISQMPFIILKGKSGEIRKALQAARNEEIHYGAFLHTMTGGTYLDQLAKTRLTDEEGLIYYGAVLWGSWEIVSQITRKFSLYK